jgi:hypothetical protein
VSPGRRIQAFYDQFVPRIQDGPDPDTLWKTLKDMERALPHRKQRKRVDLGLGTLELSDEGTRMVRAALSTPLQAMLWECVLADVVAGTRRAPVDHPFFNTLLNDAEPGTPEWRMRAIHEHFLNQSMRHRVLPAIHANADRRVCP